MNVTIMHHLIDNINGIITLDMIRILNIHNLYMYVSRRRFFPYAIFCIIVHRSFNISFVLSPLTSLLFIIER